MFSAGLRRPEERLGTGSLSCQKATPSRATEQYGWRDKFKALNNWIAAVERVGAPVFQTSDVDLREMRGFSRYKPVLPVIVNDAQDAPPART